MPDYSKGKIYKLYNEDEPDKVYIGSTVSRISHRYNQHLSASKNPQYYTTSVELFQDNKNPKIEILENYSCKSKYDLECRERYYIEQHPKCINKLLPARTHKEYYETNKNIILQNNKNTRIKQKANEELTKWLNKNKN